MYFRILEESLFMSNRLFQGVIHQMKDAIDRIIGVVDENGVIIACSELIKIGEIHQGIRDELNYTGEVVTSNGYTYRPMTSGPKNDYIVFVEGEDKMAEKMSKLLAISLGNIKNLYDEKYDKGSFIKNIILDNILPSDIYIKSKEFRINISRLRIMIWICVPNKRERTRHLLPSPISRSFPIVCLLPRISLCLTL